MQLRRPSSESSVAVSRADRPSLHRWLHRNQDASSPTKGSRRKKLKAAIKNAQSHLHFKSKKEKESTKEYSKEEWLRYLSDEDLTGMYAAPSKTEKSLSSSGESEADTEPVDSDDSPCEFYRENHVEPPVTVPAMYRMQDRSGGVLVGGRYVMYTNFVFKRKLAQIRNDLAVVPENEPMIVVSIRSAWSRR